MSENVYKKIGPFPVSASYHPYDCALNNLPGVPLPSSRLYNLSGPKHLAMDKYIKDSLDNSIIQPFSTPVGVGLFFVEKKKRFGDPALTMRVKSNHCKK